MAGTVLSREDLDELSEAAAGSDDPAAVAGQLADAAANGRLADPADAGYAYLLAAEIQERAEDPHAALALVEKALAAYRRTGSGELAQARDYRARLLLQTGREDEALAELSELPSGDPYEDEAADEYDETGESDQDDVAEPGGGRGRRYGDDGGPEAGLDAVLLVWPQDSYEQVDQRWPELLEPTGAETWDDYRRYCQGVIDSWSKRSGSSLYLVTGDADGFEEWLEEQGADPYYANLLALARSYGDELAEQGDPIELPPAPRDPCWCGSGVSYARCCQPLSA